ncbi:MAG: DUF2269 family protein [Actinomycetota bacterium]
MFTLRTVLLYIHIVCAVVWVGGAVFAQVLAIRAERSTDPSEIVRTGKSIEFVGQRLFIPASVILFLAGVWLVIDSAGYDFEQPWIAIAIVLWLTSALVGSLYLGPTSKKISLAFEAEGPTSASGTAMMKRVFLVSRIELLGLLLVIGLMVFKPGV